MSWQVFDEFRVKGIEDFDAAMHDWMATDRLDGVEWARQAGMLAAARVLDQEQPRANSFHYDCIMKVNRKSFDKAA